jgi:transcriptional regulator with XRE-family HTH domain
MPRRARDLRVRGPWWSLRLRALKNEAGITVAAMAAATKAADPQGVGVSTGTINNLLAGKGDPKASRLDLVFGVFDTAVAAVPIENLRREWRGEDGA